MKKYFVVYVGLITLGLLIFSYQSDTNRSTKLNDVQEVINVKEVTTTSTLEIDNSWENFLDAWEKSLNMPIELTYQENIINSSFLNKWEWKGDKYTAQNEFLYQIEVNGYTCTRIWNSMGWALLDMLHPIGKDYRASHTYKCDDKGEVFIFGEPFYYNNEWWVFQNYEWSWDDISCIDPCASSAQYYGTIYVIENSEELKNFTLSNPVIYNKLFKNYHSYRGIIRRTTAESISIFDIEKDLYTEKVIKPVHDFSESFSYDIKIPEINSSMKCAPEVNNEIMNIVNELVEDKKSILEITTPEKAEEEWGGFVETLEIKYDILEISEYLISIYISNTTYSFGAAHPQSFTQSINIYVPDCTKFELHKLFNKSLNNNTFTYEDVVAKEMQNQLCAQFESRSDCDNYLSFEKPFPKLSDLEECCSAIGLNELGLFVQFWAYEVSSYAEGSELILVPWHNLEILLDRSSKYKDMLEYYSSRTDLETQYEPSWSYVATNTYHLGLYGYFDFIEKNRITNANFFTTFNESYGSPSGTYFYKDSWWDNPDYIYDDLMQKWCLEDGYTQKDCDETATFEWTNPNILKGITIDNQSFNCANEINNKINELNNKYYKRAFWHGNPKPRFQGFQEMEYIVPNLNYEIFEKYFSFIVYYYDNPGGTARVGYVETYTFDLSNCREISFIDLYSIDKDDFDQILLKYLEIPNDVNPFGNEVQSMDLSEVSIFQNQFISEENLYIVLWDCRYCDGFNISFENDLPFSIGQYVLAIPLDEFANYKIKN